jgi:hypothetical protein
MLLGRPCYDPEQLPFSEEDVDRARRTIEGFGFVGVTEEFGRSICLFDAMFPGPTPAIHHDFHRSSPDPRRRAGIPGSPQSRVVGASEMSAGGGPRWASLVGAMRTVVSTRGRDAVKEYGSKRITKATTNGPRSCEAEDPDVALLDFVHTLLDARYARFGC